MVGRTNVAGARLRSVIAVTYPEGSVCTCSNGTKTLKAKDTSGKVLFNVTSAGTWTVSCTDGTDTAVTNVSITEEGQCESVELMYELYLYNRGDERTYITGGILASADPTYGGSANKNADNIYIGGSVGGENGGALSTANSIDLSNFSKLHFIMKYAVDSKNNAEVGVKTGKVYESGSSWIVKKDLVTSVSTAQDITVDISGVSSGYPYVNAWASNATVYEIWLEV